MGGLAGRMQGRTSDNPHYEHLGAITYQAGRVASISRWSAIRQLRPWSSSPSWATAGAHSSASVNQVDRCESPRPWPLGSRGQTAQLHADGGRSWPRLGAFFPLSLLMPRSSGPPGPLPRKLQTSASPRPPAQQPARAPAALAGVQAPGVGGARLPAQPPSGPCPGRRPDRDDSADHAPSPAALQGGAELLDLSRTKPRTQGAPGCLAAQPGARSCPCLPGCQTSIEANGSSASSSRSRSSSLSGWSMYRAALSSSSQLVG